MTKLNRRTFLLSAGLAVIAAPVLAKPDTTKLKVDVIEAFQELVELFDSSTPKQQQKMLDNFDPALAIEIKRSGKPVSDDVKRVSEKMKAFLKARQKVIYE